MNFNPLSAEILDFWFLEGRVLNKEAWVALLINLPGVHYKKIKVSGQDNS